MDARVGRFRKPRIMPNRTADTGRLGSSHENGNLTNQLVEVYLHKDGPVRLVIFTCMGLSHGKFVSQFVSQPFGSVKLVEREEVRWSGRRDSNPRPSAPKADALPGCATPRSPIVSQRRGVSRRSEAQSSRSEMMQKPIEHPYKHQQRHDEDSHQDCAQDRQKQPVFQVWRRGCSMCRMSSL